MHPSGVLAGAAAVSSAVELHVWSLGCLAVCGAADAWRLRVVDYGCGMCLHRNARYVRGKRQRCRWDLRRWPRLSVVALRRNDGVRDARWSESERERCRVRTKEAIR